MRGTGDRARSYPNGLTGTEWQVIAPGLPEYVPGRRGGPPVWSACRIVKAILYLTGPGAPGATCRRTSWRTAYNYFATWRAYAELGISG